MARLSLICITFFLCSCSSLLYFPATGTFLHPSKINLGFEEHYIEMNPDLRLHAWYFPAIGPRKGSIVFFHGNGENLTSHYLALNWLPREGYDYIIFDYPGYNLSTGEPTPQNTVEAGVATVDWLIKNKQPENLFIFGQSLGGAVALKTAELIKNRIAVKGIIIESSFRSYQKTGQKILNKTWITWPIQWMSYLVLSDRWTNQNLPALKPTPLLIYHSPKDNVVPYELGQDLFEHLPEPKKFIEVPEGNHGNAFFVANGKYRATLLDFLKESSLQSP